MSLKDKLKENSNKLINIASENVNKAFDYPAIKSKELKKRNKKKDKRKSNTKYKS